jgi:hemerythrin-like domain-containing protein
MTQPKVLPADNCLKNFSPTDPRYTVNEKYPPNKETTWPYPAEKSGWMMVHNALRGEIIQFQDTLSAIKARRGTLKPWEVECIQDVFIAHLYNMEEHHSTEDNILSPELMKRFKYPDKLTDDHEAIFAQLDKASEIVKSLKAGDDVLTTIGSLSQEFDRYKESIFPHFAEEEMYAIPLTRAYFKSADFNKIMKVRISKAVPISCPL